MMDEEHRLPTSLWVEGHLHNLTVKAIHFYIIRKGNPASGIVMVKLNNLEGKARLLTQQRDIMTYKLGWIAALAEEIVEEAQADAYIQRAISRDPDLWVIEVEDREMQNPFDGDIF